MSVKWGEPNDLKRLVQFGWKENFIRGDGYGNIDTWVYTPPTFPHPHANYWTIKKTNLSEDINFPNSSNSHNSHNSQNLENCENYQSTLYNIYFLSVCIITFQKTNYSFEIHHQMGKWDHEFMKTLFYEKETTVILNHLLPNDMANVVHHLLVGF